MKLTKSTIAATFAALLIGGLAISPASAKVHPSGYNETGRVDVSDHEITFELQGDTSYTTGRVGPSGDAKPILTSETGRSNGRQG
jgi:hypothetical protein